MALADTACAGALRGATSDNIELPFFQVAQRLAMESQLLRILLLILLILLVLLSHKNSFR